MARLRYPLPTLHERRCRRPCKARFRLAARLYREGVEPSGSRWKVSALLDLHRFPLPQAWPGASRVGGDVAVPTPHRPGRADFPHPVPHATASLAATATAAAVPDSLVEDRAQPTRLGASGPVRLSAPVSLTRLRASECPPCCPDAGLFAWRPPSLARVPVSRVPRGRRYYAGATTSHESPGALMVSGARTTRRLPLRSPAAETLRGSRVRSGAVDHAARWCGRRGISQVPERSILYLRRDL